MAFCRLEKYTIKALLSPRSLGDTPIPVPPELLTAVCPPFWAWGKIFASAFFVSSIREKRMANNNMQTLINLLYTDKVNKKIILLLVIVVLVIGMLFFLTRSNKPLTSPQSIQTTKIIPAETLIEYSDPSGFTFSYPDNLSLSKNNIEDDSTYADIQLSSKEVNGSLNLKITDSKFKSLDEWLNLNKSASKEAPKEVKLGNLKALEVKLADRLLMGALDQGVLFTIEMPRVEEDFWMKVYDKILSSFSFVAAETTTSDSTEEIIFEGEEVIE